MSTTDGGTTWQMDVLDDYPDEEELRALDFIASGHGWATGISGLTLKTHFPVNIETPYTDYSLNIFPNPFITSTTFEYTRSEHSTIIISIFNSQGQLIDKIEQEQTKGEHQIKWNAEGLPAGIYYYLIQTGGNVVGGKMVLMK